MRLEAELVQQIIYSGQVNARPLPETATSAASIGGKSANVYYTGLTPGYVGLAQMNIQVPELPPGDYQLVVDVGGVQTQPLLLRVQ